MIIKKHALTSIALATAALLCALLVLAGCSSAPSNNTAENTNASPEAPAPAIHDILIIGNDHWGKVPDDRSDMMLLMRLDCAKGQVNLISIPRDTRYVWENGIISKANQAYTAEGPEGALKAVNQITGLNVTNYADIGFDGLEAVVDKLGGLRMNLPYPIDYSFYTKDYPDETLPAGEQVLTGWQAMVACRARTCYGKYDLNQDMMRQIVDRQMMVDLMSAVLTDKQNAISLATELLPNVQTNIAAQDILTWINQLLQHDKLTVYTNSGPTDGDVNPEAGGAWLCYENPEAWGALMAAYCNGEDITLVNANATEDESNIAPIRATFTIDLK